MIIVIYPTGVKIQYNDANQISYENIQYGFYDLNTSKGIFVAHAPKECSISFQEPCDLKGPIFGDVDTLAEQVILRRKELSADMIRRLRRELMKFSIRKNRW